MLIPLHLQEWLNSGVDENLVRLNVTSLAGEAPLEHLLYALPKSERRNDGRLRDKYLKQYNHVQDGGWWIGGLDPLNNWQPMEWGRFKPDNPRLESRQRQDFLSPEELLECEKFRIRDTYGMEVTPELVEKDDGGRLIRKLTALEAILSEPGEIILNQNGREFLTPPSVVTERDLADRENLPICTDWGNHSAAWLLRYRLGLKDILVSLMDSREFTGSEDFLQGLAEKSKRNAPHVKAILNLSIPLDKTPNWILSQFINQLGLSTRSRREGAKGEQIRFYSLTPESVAFAMEVLEHRQRKREERQTKRQEQLEQNARYAAGMQEVYDSQPVVNPPPKRGIGTFRGGVDYRA